MPGVFISYRRDDAAPYAGRLYDRLCGVLGAATVFMDVDDIQPGEDFSRAIARHLARADTLLAVIGPAWLEQRDAQGRQRLDDPQDFVRQEIAAALAQGKRVVPLLVGGAAMPRAQDLPGDLAALARCQAVELRDASFAQDVAQLLAALGLPDSPGDAAQVGKRDWRPPATLALAALVAVFATWTLLGRRPPERATETAVAPTKNGAEAIEGTWKAKVTYGWGATQEETFRLRVSGDEVSGSAGFLGIPRAIVAGSLEPGRLVFLTRSESVEGSSTYVLTHRYRGSLEGDAIRFVLATEGGVSAREPVEFVARRVTAP